jgi:hypothetical protein
MEDRESTWRDGSSQHADQQVRRSQLLEGLKGLIPQIENSTPLVGLLLVVLLTYTLFNYASFGLLRPISFVGTDFPSLYTAAEVIRQGENPYDMEVFESTSVELGFGKRAKPYVYHPFFATLLVPLTLFDPKIANAFFALVNFAFLLAIVWFSVPRGHPQKPAALILGLILAANFSPAYSSARLGRVDLAVAFLLIVALCSLRGSRPWVGGAFVGLATMLKTTPGLLLIYFLWKRQWRALIAGGLVCAIVAGLGLVVADSETNYAFWKGITAGSIIPSARTDDPLLAGFFERSFEGSETLSEFMDRLPGHPQNISLPAIARHLFDSQSTQVLVSNPSLAGWLGLGATLLILFSLLWFTRKPIAGQRARDLLELEYSLVVTALVLIPPLTWQHHLTLLLPALLVLGRLTLLSRFKPPDWNRWIAFAVCYAGLAVNYSWVAGFQSGVGLLVMSTKTYFMLLLYGVLAWWLS